MKLLSIDFMEVDLRNTVPEGKDFPLGETQGLFKVIFNFQKDDSEETAIHK
tara:strand:- start:1525 stop:1677 length:153 start_codon:yes stop_codon:yes gene_type:complete